MLELNTLQVRQEVRGIIHRVITASYLAKKEAAADVVVGAVVVTAGV